MSAEKSQADLWRFITLLVFGIGIVLVIVNLVLSFRGAIGLNLLLVRFAIAVSIALPAIYTARESARHRSNADKAKQTELELASLGPYLETLPSESKEKVIVELSKLYFGREVSEHKVEFPIDVQRLLDTISKLALSKAPGGLAFLVYLLFGYLDLISNMTMHISEMVYLSANIYYCYAFQAAIR